MEKKADHEDEEKAKQLAHKAKEQLKKKQEEEEAEREKQLLRELKEQEERVAQEKAKLEAQMKKLQEVRRSTFKIPVLRFMLFTVNQIIEGSI